MLISQCLFDGPPLELMGPLLGPLNPTVFLKPMGPLKSMGPGVIVPPAPLSAPLILGCEAKMQETWLVESNDIE